jgi:hypothetical protein
MYGIQTIVTLNEKTSKIKSEPVVDDGIGMATPTEGQARVTR